MRWVLTSSADCIHLGPEQTLRAAPWYASDLQAPADTAAGAPPAACSSSGPVVKPPIRNRHAPQLLFPGLDRRLRRLEPVSHLQRRSADALRAERRLGHALAQRWPERA